MVKGILPDVFEYIEGHLQKKKTKKQKTGNVRKTK
jgi:hypothetical protein